MKTLLLTTSILAAGCWAMPHAYADRPATPAERQAAGFDDPAIPYMIREMPAARSHMPRSPKGIPGSKFQTRLGAAFLGRTSDYTFGFAPPPSTGCDSGTERFATAAFDLPQGAKIHYVDIFGFDASASDDMLVFLQQVCQDLGSLDPPVVTQLGNTTTSGSAGNALVTLDFSAAPIEVNRYTCHYLVRVNLAYPSGACTTSIGLDKARIQYTNAGN